MESFGDGAEEQYLLWRRDGEYTPEVKKKVEREDGGFMRKQEVKNLAR